MLPFLQLHLVKNPECVCPICDKYFPQKYILMQHVRLSHLFRNRNKNLTRKPKCGACHKRFDTKKILLEHLQSVHKQETVACGQCDSSFPNKILLNAHIAKSHDFQCRRCLLKCYSQDKLDEHIKIHENNPAKFICRHCGKGFSTVTHLVRHLRVRIIKNCFSWNFIKNFGVCRYIQVKNQISVNFAESPFLMLLI